MTYTLTTPLIRRRSHIETHAYQAPHPCRCSGVCLASIPLFAPSLPCLKSLIKTLTVCGSEVLKPFLLLPSSLFNPPSLSPFCLIENVYSRRDPGEGENMSEREEGAESKASGWEKWEVRDGREERRTLWLSEMVIANEREGLSGCEVAEPRALVRFCPSLLSLEPQRLLSCSCST